jgi:hypothetical protein
MIQERRSFFEKKEPKKLLLRFAPVWHGQRPNQKIKVFLLLFVHKKKCLLAFSENHFA